MQAMVDQVSAVNLRRYYNKSTRRVEWTDVFGRRRVLEVERGGDFAPGEGLARLVARGLVEELIPRRNYEGELPYSTQRQIPY
jgi:hypothetical protein